MGRFEKKRGLQLERRPRHGNLSDDGVNEHVSSQRRCGRGAERGRRLRAEAVLLHLSPEGDSAYLKGLGGLASIASETFERTLDHCLLLLLKIEAVVTGALASFLRHLRW